MTATEIQHTMRVNNITIRDAARLLGTTLKRVREVRKQGTTNPVVAWEYREYLPARALA